MQLKEWGFDEEVQAFRQTFRRFLEKEAVPYYEQWENKRRIPRSFWKKMGGNGWLCPTVDEQFGGAGADWRYAVAMIEEMERVGSGLSGITLHSEIVVPYISTYGTEEQKKRWLPGCVRGDLITAIAMTEPGTGSDLSNITTTARLDGDDYVLNGQKTFITNGIHADLVVVACKTNPDIEPKHKGISLIVVERGTPGFERGKQLEKVGLHCQDTAELFFDECRVPVRNRLGEEGFGFSYLMNQLQQERLVVALSAWVAADEMFQTTLQYVKNRNAFGKPIGQFQHTQFTMAEMATEIELGRVFLGHLIEKHRNGDNCVTEVSMAKWWLTNMAKGVATSCMQLHGGYGYMEEYPIARRFRDIAVTSIYAGTNEIMKSIIAKQLGLGEGR